MKPNRNEDGFSNRLRFENDAKEDVTSGQVGPKLKQQLSATDSPPTSDTSDAPPLEKGGSAAPTGRSKYRPHSEQARFSDRLRREEEPPSGGDGGSASDGGGASSDKKAARNDRRFEKSKFRAEKTGAKLDAARQT